MNPVERVRYIELLLTAACEDDSVKPFTDDHRALFQAVMTQANALSEMAGKNIEAEAAAEQVFHLASLAFNAKTGNHCPHVVQALAMPAIAQLKTLTTKNGTGTAYRVKPRTK